MLIPALLAIRIVPALETQAVRHFAHFPVAVVAANVLSQRFEDVAVIFAVLFTECVIGGPGIQKLYGRIPE